MRMIPIDSVSQLLRLLNRRGVSNEPWRAVLPVQDLSEARGVLRSAAALWRWKAKHDRDPQLMKAARVLFDAAECKQVVTAGEDL